MTATVNIEWTPGILDACQERCAEFGEPQCSDIESGCRPCADCVIDAGIEIPPDLDPSAVVRPLL